MNLPSMSSSDFQQSSSTAQQTLGGIQFKTKTDWTPIAIIAGLVLVFFIWRKYK